MARPTRPTSDFRYLADQGISQVVSLLEPGEAANSGLSEEHAACAAAGVLYANHPIRDMHLPEPAAFGRLAQTLSDQIREGGRIAVHCYAGIGRSGMLACLVLGQFGYDTDAALAHVTLMRGTPVPDTPEQARFLRQMMANQHR